MTGFGIAFDPALPWAVIAALGAVALAGIVFAAFRGSTGWWLRGLALGVLVLALAGPELRREQREGLTSVAFLVVDRSESTELEDRASQIDAAATALTERIEALSRPEQPVDLRVVDVAPDPSGNGGTELLTALDEAAARVSPDQIAGAILLSDGQIHDADRIEGFPAPVHSLIAGSADGFDLRLELITAPTFGIVGETVSFKLTAHALGQLPGDLGASVQAEIAIDGGAPEPVMLELGAETLLEIAIDHGGPNVVDIRIPGHAAELTTRNNRILAEVNGVRDRLRVLLVSGEPHPGGRTWRDILKADPAVDLIHFTILRPPGKQDGTPVSELSLITFPTRELFLEKIDGFDLIVFDRYRWRGILHTAFLRNIAKYVREGGAVLVASGPAFAGAQSLSRTPLIDIMPARPSIDVIERPYLPRVTDLGQRHPVTAGLEQSAGLIEGAPDWGRWMRHIPVEPVSGHVVMSGADDLPLLILDRVEEGRVALLASDHAWLWTRGFEGGGPQADLLRRTAHWLMREPELEEEALVARVDGSRVILERRSLAETPPEAAIAAPPSGPEQRELAFQAVGPGRWQAVLSEAEEGLWRFRSGEIEAVAAVGPPSPREYENPLASQAPLDPLVTATGGKAGWLADAVPEIRMVAEGRRAFSRRWLGLEAREAFNVTGVDLTPLLPAWLAALIAALLSLAAWRFESR